MPTRSDHGPESRPKHQPPRPMGTLVLAGFMVLLVVAAWAVFLLLAPEPVIMPPRTDGTPVAQDANPKQLRFLAWANAIDPEVLAAFEAETGLTVTLDAYTSNEQLSNLAARGGLDHDLVLASGVGLSRLVTDGRLRPLPVNELSNYGMLDPALMARANAYDPGNIHSVALLWGTVGLAYNRAALSAHLGPDAAADTWALLFDASMAGKLSACGIQVLDSPARAFPIALNYLGLPPDSGAAEDTEAAARLWESARPYISRFGAADLVAALAEGRICIAVTTSGDVFQARAQARAAGATAEIGYSLPQEGAVMWFDLLAVPEAARHVSNALRLVDYLLRPEVAARLTNSRGFVNAVPRSELFVRPEIKNDPMLFPGVSELARLTPEGDPPPEIVGLRTRFWRLINAPSARPQN